MKYSLTELKQIAEDSARAAGALLRAGWGKPHAIQFKGDTNLVTEVDRAAEALLVERFNAATPDFDILGEESGAHTRGSAWRWVIDPVDGTTNYAHHFPYFATSIGLEEHGESMVGVIYEPILDQLFAATRGGGATLNGAPIRVSAQPSVGKSILGTGLVYEMWESDRGIAEIVRMIKHAQTIRINGCASLDMANVACGRMDGYCDTGLFPWDISAARLILSEAGGVFRLYGAGETVESKYLIGSNGLIQRELEELLLARA